MVLSVIAVIEIGYREMTFGDVQIVTGPEKLKIMGLQQMVLNAIAETKTGLWEKVYIGVQIVIEVEKNDLNRYLENCYANKANPAVAKSRAAYQRRWAE